MKKIVPFMLACAWLAACSDKDVNQPKPSKPGQPEMLYTDLKDKEVKKNGAVFIDVDQDGLKDLFFNTMLVGDALNKLDKLQFFVLSLENRHLLSSLDDRTPVYKKGDAISLANNNGYYWNHVLQLVLAQKNTGIAGPPYWIGDWKNASHKFIALQVDRGGKRYGGWIEISFDTANEKIILYRCAISKDAGKNVVAGQ
ncbi:hypothetical protein [Foetidibacter luteolus]|uniref:hypothetical protein n=1 Tax=Foetidibacter luteolus TaxID=2608880 RepID=UPI00129C0363|nr:hypothetical protein [Foetidibacter luteolus]